MTGECGRRRRGQTGLAAGRALAADVGVEPGEGGALGGFGSAALGVPAARPREPELVHAVLVVGEYRPGVVGDECPVRGTPDCLVKAVEIAHEDALVLEHGRTVFCAAAARGRARLGEDPADIDTPTGTHRI